MKAIFKKSAHLLKYRILAAVLVYVSMTILLILLISLFSSCKKEEFDFGKFAGQKDGAEWGIPLIHGNLGILDIINDTNHVSLTEGNLVTITYSSEMETPKLGDLISIPDLGFSSTFTFNMPEYVPEDDSVFIPYSQLMNLSPDVGIRIDSMQIVSCIIELEFNTNLNRDAKIKIRIPSAVKDNNAFESEILYRWSNQPDPINLVIDLGGYNLGLKNSGSFSSSLEVVFDVLVYNNANPDLDPYTLNVNQNIKDISFQKFSGYIGNFTIPFASTSIPLDIFKNRLSGNIDFQNPKITFIAENSIGAPVQLQLVNIRSYFADNPEQNTSISGSFQDQPWIINAAENGQWMKNSISNFEINKDNSSIREILYDMPDRLSFSAKITTNPDNGETTNFFYNESSVKMSMDVELPLHGITNNLILQDKFQFNFDDLEKLKSAEFKVNLTNSFPANSGMQVYFADADLIIIDSLFSSPMFVEAGETDPVTMKVISPSETTLTNTFDENRFEMIKYETKNILVYCFLDTPDNTVIKIFADNYLDVRIGALYTKY